MTRSPTRTRLTAAERGEQVLRAAVTAFSDNGYAATKTDEIARLAGVTQPYVIRLFGTKQQLFVAAVQRACDRVEHLFRAAAAEHPDLAHLGDAYQAFLTEPELPTLMLHGFAASADPAIGEPMRERFGRMYALIRELTGASPSEASRFLSTGMLLTVLAGLRVVGPDATPASWADQILGSLTDEDC